MARVASAKRHAQAVLQLALDSNEVEGWRSQLKTIAATLTDPELAAILENPKVHLSDKAELISRCLPQLNELALNFAYLLVAKQRTSILAQIVAEYERMADAHQGLEHAEVITAIPLNEEDKERLTRHLATMTGKQIVLAADVDPAIIGGFIARVGDKLIDGSTKGRLEALKQKMIQAT